MTESDLDVPYLRDKQIDSAAERFLGRVNPSATIPVRIEWIVEMEGFDIVPTPRLRADFDLDGCANLREKRIYIDKMLMEQYEHRYRFTLAHEMGHVQLHPQLFAVMDKEPSTLTAWIHRQQRIPDEVYRRADFQAHRFATFALLPGEPLRREMGKHLPGVKSRVTAATKAGAGKGAASDYGWEMLVEQLAEVFCVSRAVAEHRLRFGGHSPKTLFL